MREAGWLRKPWYPKESLKVTAVCSEEDCQDWQSLCQVCLHTQQAATASSTTSYSEKCLPSHSQTSYKYFFPPSVMQLEVSVLQIHFWFFKWSSFQERPTKTVPVVGGTLNWGVDVYTAGVERGCFRDMGDVTVPVNMVRNVLIIFPMTVLNTFIWTN